MSTGYYGYSRHDVVKGNVEFSWHWDLGCPRPRYLIIYMKLDVQGEIV